ncbi:uncharacterized protein LOC133317799 [Gastrolobium bilobum]|uniref:uncharacterized protein LOC133317799 n=1 Tax=Gastrolobium bilobum TaxID=150636 RepID=UPI002AAFE524|nr:uncharacterized protein LOC133317799 [Gastrolobium bilobum]
MEGKGQAGEEDPLCPRLILSAEEHKRDCEKWSKALIIKLLGKRIVLRFLLARLQKSWNLVSSFEAIDLDNGFLLLRFQNDGSEFSGLEVRKTVAHVSIEVGSIAGCVVSGNSLTSPAQELVNTNPIKGGSVESSVLSPQKKGRSLEVGTKKNVVKEGKDRPKFGIKQALKKNGIENVPPVPMADGLSKGPVKGKLKNLAGSEGPNILGSSISNSVKKDLGGACCGDPDSKTYVPGSRNVESFTNLVGGGVGKTSFPTLIRDLKFRFKISIMALLETRVGVLKGDDIIRKLGFSSFFSQEHVGFFGGIWLLWEGNLVDVEVLIHHHQFVHTKVTYLDSKKVDFITFVYGSPRRMERRALWLELEDISYGMTDPWLVLGDFNDILYAFEKIGGQELCWKGMDEFNQCLFNCNVSDMGFKGPDFTWKRGRLQERLDKACFSEARNISWPNRFVSHLPFYNSDHRPILLCNEMVSVPMEHSRSFKFMAAWLTDSRFGELVRSCWENGNWMTARRKFEVDARFWHQNVFKENELWRKLQSVLVKEELTWFQRPRNQWLKFGGKNTRFFHASTVARRRHNRIVTLKDEGGNWIADSESLVQLAVSFYQDLFTIEGVREDKFPIQKVFPRLAECDKRRLALVPSKEEIKRTVFMMEKFKARPDELSAIFFQSQWGTVGDSVCSLVMDVFNKPEMVRDINGTLICLIPKKESPESIRDFRPISLCNVVYKIITKIIVGRLKDLLPRIVSLNQCSFIKGRQGFDNVIIVQEVIHSMRVKKGSQGWMMIKVDLEKAYDRLDWSFILETLDDIGLPEPLSLLIYKCISTSSMSLLWNGVVTKEIFHERGIRQGDLISPLLFVLCMEKLSQLIQVAVDSRAWKPIFLRKKTPPISNLLFADDIIICAEASVEQAQSTVLPLGVCNEIEKITRNFIWGSSQSQGKVHLVSWNRVCRPKKDGGLGFRDQKLINRAYSMKLGFDILSNRDSLWVKVLQNKYKVEESFMPTLRKSNCASNTWRGIQKVWDQVLEGSRIIIGTGSNTSFWYDRWVPNIGRLVDWSLSNIPEAMKHWKVSDCVQRGSWDWDKFSPFLSKDILVAIEKIMSSFNYDEMDRVIWSPSNSGSFSVKSAYNLLANPSVSSISLQWDTIWKWAGPQRIKFFLWLAAGNKLLTNAERFRRHFSTSEACPSCQNLVDDTDHILRKCPWDRNSLVFNNKSSSPQGLFSQASIYVANINTANGMLSAAGLVPVGYEEILVSWCPPWPGWIKINTYEAFSERLSYNSCGGVARDELGNWISGFYKRLYPESVLMGELWGILIGLDWAWGYGSKQIMIESDSLVAVHLVKEGCVKSHPCHEMVYRIRAMMDKDWKVEIDHVFRESNQVADWLASSGRQYVWDTQWHESCPLGCAKLVLDDRRGIMLPRNFAV